MEYINRLQAPKITEVLERNKSVLLLGPRQTGKTTLLNLLKSDLYISFAKPKVRQQHETDLGLLIEEVQKMAKGKSYRPLVLLDEVQKVPHVMDSAQYLIDSKVANFVLTGSSARKLRRGPNVNLLPGRVIALHLDPLVLSEHIPSSLEDLLLYGSLPGILALEEKNQREEALESYVTIYLEEEVRAEAIVRNLGSFARFLEYAAAESGQGVNFRKLSQEIGVAQTTIMDYYQILEDCLIAERIEPLIKSKTRRKLTRAQKYLFFDLGVRRLAAREGTAPAKEIWGRLFEQWVGLELLKCMRLAETRARLRFWRDPSGPEVDWIIERKGHFIPVEVKWTAAPAARDIKHLEIFLSEYSNSREGYLVCRVERPLQMTRRITAIPWQQVDDLIFKPEA